MKPCLCIQKCVSMMVFLEVLGFKPLVQHRFLNLAYTGALLQGLGCSLPHHGVRTPWGARRRGFASVVPWTRDFCFWASGSLCRSGTNRGLDRAVGSKWEHRGRVFTWSKCLLRAGVVILDIILTKRETLLCPWMYFSWRCLAESRHSIFWMN